MSGILKKIISATQQKVESAKRADTAEEIIRVAQKRREAAAPNAFRRALESSERINIIAEFKRASPSKGVIATGRDAGETALCYERGGAAAVSVLTEETFFGGSLDDLRQVRAAVKLPILRKDFIIDRFQIFEAAAAGADAILLIVAALEKQELEKLLQTAREELRLDALVECHSAAELETAVAVGADLVGINNRNLDTFEVSLDVSRRLIMQKSPNTLMISESGFSDFADIRDLRNRGFDAFLIGESLMKESDAEITLKRWTSDGSARIGGTKL